MKTAQAIERFLNSPGARRRDAAFLSPRRRGVRTLARTPEPGRCSGGRAGAHRLRGRARARAAAKACAGDDRAKGRGDPQLPPLHARAEAGARRRAVAAAAEAASRHAQDGRGRGGARGARGRRAARRCATARSSSSSTRRGCAARRRSGSTSPTSTSTASSSTCAARAARSGSSRSEKRRATWLAKYLHEARPQLVARSRERTVPVGTRQAARHVDPAPHLCPSPPPAARVRNPSARRRRRPAHDPGPPRPQLFVDHAALQPCGRPPACGASTTRRIPAPKPARILTFPSSRTWTCWGLSLTSPVPPCR